MLNTICAELMKMRKSRIFLAGTCLVLLVPLLIIIKDLLLAVPPANPVEWLNSIRMITSLLLPVIGSFILTFLIQREYQELTIINVLTAPLSRTAFLFAKVVVWLLWHSVVLCFMEVICLIGYFLIYPNAFHWASCLQFIRTMTINGIFSFIASLPFVWIAVKQKKIFYPSILTALVFAAIQAAGANTSAPMLPVASAVPWSAVSLVSMYELPAKYQIRSIASILLVGTGSLLLACITFHKQDQ